MQVFRNRARRGHHGHRADVANGTRIITSNHGHGHSVVVPATHVSDRHGNRVRRGTTTVVAANVPSGHHRRRHNVHHGTTTVVAASVPSGHGHSGHGHSGHGHSGHGHSGHGRSGHGHGVHVTNPHDQRRYYRDDPSTIHGLWNKVLGTLTGNRRRRRHGDREMRKARERRDDLRVARGGQRVRATGGMTKLRKFRASRRQRRRDRREPVVITPDNRRGQDQTPWLHYKHRTLPPYHGMHHRILGFFTGGRERRAMGEAMAAAAEEERRRERRRRGEELQEMGRRYRNDRRRWA